MGESVNVRIPEQVKEKLQKLAKENGVSMGAMIAVLIANYEKTENKS